MAPPKATAWPASIYEDPDVLTLDEAGRFIICGVCADSYAMRRGKKPKPVVMNACFRTRAWETHKLRTRAHRLPKSETRPKPQQDSFQDSEPFRPRRAQALVHPQEGFVLPRLESINTAQPRTAIPSFRGVKPSFQHQMPSPLVFPLSRISSQRSGLSRLDLLDTRQERKGPVYERSSGFHIQGLLNPHQDSTRPSQAIHHFSARPDDTQTSESYRSTFQVVRLR